MKKNRRNQRVTAERDDTDITTDSEVLRQFIQTPKPYKPVSFSLPAPSPALKAFSDLRRWHPDKVRAADSLPRSAARLQIAQGKTSFPKRSALPWRIGFAQPKGVAVCVRRKSRREVLFALNRTGAGARAYRRRRNEWSSVKC